MLRSVRTGVSRVLANPTLGTGPTLQRGVTSLSLALDESSQAENPIISGSSGSPPLPVRFAGSGSIPAQSRTTARRIVEAVITEFVINYPMTLIAEKISRAKISAVCSNVLDLLRTQSPLVALPATLEQRSAESAETMVATREGISALSPSRRGRSQESGLLVSSSHHKPTLSNAASRQQFLCALLEDCSFFAHLVLRCVRATGCSLESASPGSDCRSTSVIQSRPSCDVLVRRARRNVPTIETEPVPPTLQTLWANAACRHLRPQRCTGEVS